MKSFSLIEQDTVFGDTTLDAGDFLFTQEAGSDNDVYSVPPVMLVTAQTAGTSGSFDHGK